MLGGGTRPGHGDRPRLHSAARSSRLRRDFPLVRGPSIRPVTAGSRVVLVARAAGADVRMMYHKPGGARRCAREPLRGPHFRPTPAEAQKENPWVTLRITEGSFSRGGL